MMTPEHIALFREQCDNHLLNLVRSYNTEEPDVFLLEQEQFQRITFKGYHIGSIIYVNPWNINDYEESLHTLYHEFWHFKRVNKNEYTEVYQYYENHPWYIYHDIPLKHLFYHYSLIEIDARLFGDSLGTIEGDNVLDLFRDIHDLPEIDQILTIYRQTLEQPPAHLSRLLMQLLNYH